MRNKFLLCALITALLLPAFLDAREQVRPRDSDLLFPSGPEPVFRDESYAHSLYDKMIETMRKAETLYYESQSWLTGLGLEGTKLTCKVWLKKPAYARLEVLSPRTGQTISILISDGDYFWKFWPDGLVRSTKEKWSNVYIREPVKGYSIKWDARLVAGNVIDPSIFHGSVEEPYQEYMDGVRWLSTEKLGDEECEVIEVSFLNNQRSKYIWLSKSDNLPRKLEEMDKGSRHRRRETVSHEIWSNVKVNSPIPMERFVWKPPGDWRRITQSALHSGELPSLTESMNLSGKWKYAFSDDVSWAAMVCDDAKWEIAEIPYIPPPQTANKRIWLRKAFFIPDDYEGRKYSLNLGIPSAPARAYFNGELVAETGMNKPLESAGLQNVLFGEDNVVAVRIELPEGNNGIHWTGEPVFKGISGWIEASYFNEEDFTVQHYVIYVPQNYTPNEAFPLVFALAGGYGGRYSFMRNGSNIGEFAESRGYIVACPEIRQEELKRDVGTRWITPAEQEVLLILSEMKERYNIDPRRVYIMGLSNGGFVTYYMGFRHPELFAAIAPLSGAIGGTQPDVLPRMARAAKERIPVFIVHGAKDTVIPISRAHYVFYELRRIGYQCEMYTYPENGHELAAGEIEKVLDFFGKYTKEGISEAWKELEVRKPQKLPGREEKSIKGVIKRYVEGYNKKDAEQVMSCLSSAYSTDGIEYLDVRDRMSEFMSDKSRARMWIKDVNIMLNAEDVSIVAIVQCGLELDGKPETDRKLWLKFVKVDKDWKIIGGDYAFLGVRSSR